MRSHCCCHDLSVAMVLKEAGDDGEYRFVWWLTSAFTSQAARPLLLAPGKPVLPH